jgi:hypothetical protein
MSLLRAEVLPDNPGRAVAVPAREPAGESPVADAVWAAVAADADRLRAAAAWAAVAEEDADAA